MQCTKNARQCYTSCIIIYNVKNADCKYKDFMPLSTRNLKIIIK